MKKNSMKKNRMLRLASTLMILTLLTTSIIGGTFAKYTTTGSASDTARVAKWGVVINASGSLYSDAYKKQVDGNLPAAWTASPAVDAITVAAVTKDGTTTSDGNIVAPGTESYGNGLSFSISGKPEVAVKVTTDITAEDIYLKTGHYGVLVPATVSDNESLKKIRTANGDEVYQSNTSGYTKVTDGDSYVDSTTYYILTNDVNFTGDYFPVEYKLDSTTTGATTTGSTKAVDIASVLANAVNDGATATTFTNYKKVYTGVSHNFAANTDLATAGPKFGGENLTWKWAYGSDTALTEDDKKDTILGNLIAARAGDVDYVVVSVGADDAVTALECSDTDYTVTDGTGVVANLRTLFDISLTVEQVD